MKNLKSLRVSLFSLIALLLLEVAQIHHCNAQESAHGVFLPIIIVDSKKFAIYTLPEVTVVSKRTFHSWSEQCAYDQLKKNILIVYPYAQKAGELYNEAHTDLSKLDKKRDQKKYVKEKQDSLEEMYTQSLKDLNTVQGKLLIKLTARATGVSVYDLLKEFKNSFTAFCWNKVGQHFGYSLKEEYNPQEDKDIELIVRSIEGNI